jgi:hypothetical protein
MLPGMLAMRAQCTLAVAVTMWGYDHARQSDVRAGTKACSTHEQRKELCTVRSRGRGFAPHNGHKCHLDIVSLLLLSLR